ncbi:hypothetical protein PtA15_11A664 [Puccinia triticina]|uniref:DUF7872 domain-containing protein n=1 Tax=Puccinia triticina TaxID=208348 RepID=A0ABY7D136_9BASI|nr:uncharacterized protein PtA15_11A664 [Puccinia triticina]WAQ89972.1 hypothetical protein PtA15_11A664 [Puccinia triticina]WAR60008.1 hypothetical protein PtB15_11B649 [Puccinia triticina]
MNRYQALIGWLSLSFLKNTFASIPAPQAILPGPSPNTNNTTCQIYPNTIESWNQLGVDQFLSDFPGGKDTPLDDFIFGNRITNFVCGLGENCLAGQQCLPFQGSLWFMLYSLQEWNLYVNSLYDATTGAVAQIKAWGVATEAELLEEQVGVDTLFQSTIKLEPRSLAKRSLPPENQLSLDAVNESQKTLASELQGLPGDFGTSSTAGTSDLKQMNKALYYLTKKSIWSELVVSVLSGDEEAFNRIKTNVVAAYETNEEQRLVRRSAPQDIPSDHFATWNVINTYLTSFCDHLKSVIAVTSQIGVTAPISSDEGVWGIIKGGKFLSPNPNMSQLQDKLRETMRLSALAQVLKSMNVFVTIGSVSNLTLRLAFSSSFLSGRPDDEFNSSIKR